MTRAAAGETRQGAREKNRAEMTQIFLWAGKSERFPIRDFEQILFNESGERFTNVFLQLEVIVLNRWS